MSKVHLLTPPILIINGNKKIHAEMIARVYRETLGYHICTTTFNYDTRTWQVAMRLSLPDKTIKRQECTIAEMHQLPNTQGD